MQSAGSNSGEVLQDLHSKIFRMHYSIVLFMSRLMFHWSPRHWQSSPIALIKSLPTKKEQKQMQTQLGTSCKPNPMLELAVDVHQ